MGMVLHASAFFVLTKPFPECIALVLIPSVWRKNDLPSQFNQDLDLIPQKTNEPLHNTDLYSEFLFISKQQHLVYRDETQSNISPVFQKCSGFVAPLGSSVDVM